MDPAGPTTRSEAVLDAPAARVWEALCDPAEVPRWWVRQEGDPRRDARVVWHVEEAGPGEPLDVVAAEAPRRLRLVNAGDAPWRGTAVEVALRAEGAHTAVVLTQTLPAGLADHAPNVEAGWTMVLALLREYLERHAGETAHRFRVWRETPVDAGRAAASLASDEAIARWAGEAPRRVLARSPRAAAFELASVRGVLVAFAVTGGVGIDHAVWGAPDDGSARPRAEALAASLAEAVR